MTMWPRRRAVHLATLATLVLAACRIEAPFARDNPFDAEGDVTISLAGPDTVRGAGTRFRMTVASSKPFPPGELFISWSSSNPMAVASAGAGEFVVVIAGPTYFSVLITAQLDSRVLTRTVWVGPAIP